MAIKKQLVNQKTDSLKLQIKVLIKGNSTTVGNNSNGKEIKEQTKERTEKRTEKKSDITTAYKQKRKQLESLLLYDWKCFQSLFKTIS